MLHFAVNAVPAVRGRNKTQGKLRLRKNKEQTLNTKHPPTLPPILVKRTLFNFVVSTELFRGFKLKINLKSGGRVTTVVPQGEGGGVASPVTTLKK